MNAINHNYCTSVSLFILSQKCYAIALLQSGLKCVKTSPIDVANFQKRVGKKMFFFGISPKIFAKMCFSWKCVATTTLATLSMFRENIFFPTLIHIQHFLFLKIRVLTFFFVKNDWFCPRETYTHIRSFSCCPSPYHIISLFVFFTNILNKLLNLLSWSPPPQVWSLDNCLRRINSA